MAQTKEEIRKRGRGEEEGEWRPDADPWLVRPRKYLTDGERRAAPSATSVRSAELHIAEGKCEKWTKPLDRNSVRERTEHLETHSPARR